ncbi:hypothetical protein [Flexithrix dorotheae]|uniref:AbiU2 domain-containing protein n=1 Tax=Flexithrix dorotheae TaxID=70993 RepID=UPI00036246E6|nr:hypothetical protein [Flexithrix dorotheae]
MNEIKSKLKGIVKILGIANRAYFITRYLHEPKNDDHAGIILNSDFLRFSKYSYFYMLVIELNKLVINNQSQKYNLFKLINLLENNKNEINNKISKEKILELKNMLNAINSRSISSLKNLRDKLYAHQDNINSDFFSENNLTLDEVGRVLSTAKEIIRQIYLCLEDEDFKFDIIPEITIAERHIKRMVDLQSKELELLKLRIDRKK